MTEVQLWQNTDNTMVHSKNADNVLQAFRRKNIMAYNENAGKDYCIANCNNDKLITRNWAIHEW
jgi:hypothetical protein